MTMNVKFALKAPLAYLEVRGDTVVINMGTLRVLPRNADNEMVLPPDMVRLMKLACEAALANKAAR